MAIFKSFNDIVINMMDYLRLVQNDLDTKPGTVSRDLFIDSPAQEMAQLYSQLRNIANLSSMFSSNGTDLDNFASNFNVSRNPGSFSTGVAILTTNTLDSDIPIYAGSVIVSNSGITFQIVNNTSMKTTSSNVYKATATRLQTELNLAGITDKYAIEVNVESLTLGSGGNIGPNSLISQNISGIANVTNLQTFFGGTDPEGDDAFRTRILSVFSGSNTGTSLGYTNTVNALSGVDDSFLVGPGDPLMTRDGTQVSEDSDGNLTITSIGTGGKVDIYILGSNLISQSDSFIYNDQSGKHDPTNPLNDFVLGQRGQSTNINAAQRRTNLIGTQQLPFQPTDSIVSVIGSSSGANFVEKYTDSAGIVYGNYELIKDTGDFGGSPFGFDRLRWISDKIDMDGEEITKGVFNGTDSLQFSDIEEINNISQDFLITNENVFVNSSNRSLVTLKHTPIRNVNRVVNLTTGERYIVSDQNPNGESSELNTTGNITISGSSLPSGTDTLQVDYVWVKYFDKVFDFDNLKDYNQTRFVQNSIDWSFSNLIQNEEATIEEDAYGNLFITLSSSINSVISVLEFSTFDSLVNNGSVGVGTGTIVLDVLDIKRATDNAELYNTDSRNGILTGTNIITLPTDTIAQDGDNVSIRYNTKNIFSSDAYGSGVFSNNIINLPSGSSSAGTIVVVNYIADILTIVPENNISDLPVTSYENSLLINNAVIGFQPTTYVFSGSTIVDDLKKASTNLRISVSSLQSNGVFSILGSTIHCVSGALMTFTAVNGLEIDVSSLILEDLNITSIPSSVRLAKIYSVERVNIDSSNNVLSVDNLYDIINYKLNDNTNDIRIALKDTSLSHTSFALPETPNNVTNQLNTGDIIRITFYYINTNDSETVYFSKDGEQITKKIFTTISKIYINSGFKDISGVVSGVFSINNFNQPSDNTVYDVNYNYSAPKENERITVTYNYNSLISGATLAIEEVRPITADILIKSAIKKDINVSIRIVLFSDFLDQEQTVIQNAINAVTSLLTANSLGTTIDSSDIIDVLYSVQGIDRVRILNFSESGGDNVLSITAKPNEYLNAGTINIESETR